MRLSISSIRKIFPLSLIISLFILFPIPARAAEVPSPFDSVHVYLVTVGPGAEVYEKFGHNMIRVVGPAAALGQPEDVDTAVNWGVFSFEQQNFIWRFIQGRMLYSTEASPFVDVLAEYKQNDRSVWQQALNLSAEQKERLWNKLVWNVQKENADYRYDYYRDNCSTRTRDALNDALGGQIRQQLESIPANTTYRLETRRLMRVNFWLYTALQYVLGPRVDQPLSAWQQCFLPVKMMGWINQVHVVGPDGKSTPLVISQQQLLQSAEYPEPASPPQWTWIYLLIGLTLAGIFLALPFAKSTWRLCLPWGIVAVAWCILGAAGGSILIFAWLFTDHVVALRNENILQLSPLMLPLIVLILIALFGKRWAIKAAFWLIAIQAVCNILGVLLKIFPAFRQPNIEIIALALPANLALAISFARALRYNSRHAG